MPNEFPPDDIRNVWQNQPVENTPMPLEEIQRRARRFEKMCIRDRGENSAGNWFLRAIILDKLHQIKPAKDAYEHFLALSQGKNPDQEFQARQRARILQREIDKR